MSTFTESKLTSTRPRKALMAKADLLILGSTLPRFFGDSTPSFVLDLAKSQQKHFEVTLLAPKIPNSSSTELLSGVNVKRYRYWPFAQTLADGAILDNLKAKKSNWLQVPFLFTGLFFAIKKQKPELIHAHWIIPQGLIASLAAPKAKLLVTTHGGDIYALNHAILKRVKIWVLNRATAISTVNNQMREQLISWGIDGKKIHVLPMGVDIKAAQGQSLKRKPNTIALVGRLVEKKGIEYLLEALRKGQLEKRLPNDLMVSIAGDGPIKDELVKLAAGLPVTFLGNQSKDQVRRLFAESQIAILPSVTALSGDQEGLPVTLLEAAAAGAFLIASNLPGINQVIRDGETGLLVEQRDADGILAALERAFSDPKLVKDCQAKLLVEVENYDHEVIGNKYIQLLETIR